MSERNDSPRAVVREVGGRLVLDDPDARGMIRAVERENIRRQFVETTEMRERICHFADRIGERGDDGTRYLIAMLCVDDPNGAGIADGLMPGHDWDAIRALGQIPYARGLVDRVGFQDVLDSVQPEVGAELRAIDGIAIVAADRGVVVVFELGEVVFA